MARKSFGAKSAVAGIGIRTASEQLIQQLEKTGVSSQIIGQLRALLRQLPGSSLIKNAIRVWANKLDEKVLAAIEPWLEELFRSESEETDMPPKGKQGQKKGGGGNPVDKALALIDALDDARRLKLKHWLESYSVGVKNIILEKLSARNAQSLKAFVQDLMVKEESSENKVDLLNELGLRGSTELAAAGAQGDATDVADKARKVLTWVLEEDQETFRRISLIMKSSSNDTTGDRKSFNEFLASFHSLEKKEAVAQLKVITSDEPEVDTEGKVDVNALSRVFGVRPNYPTLLMQLPGKVWNLLRRTAPKKEAFQSYLDLVNTDLQAQGLSPIATPENLK